MAHKTPHSNSNHPKPSGNFEMSLKGGIKVDKYGKCFLSLLDKSPRTLEDGNVLDSNHSKTKTKFLEPKNGSLSFYHLKLSALTSFCLFFPEYFFTFWTRKAFWVVFQNHQEFSIFFVRLLKWSIFRFLTQTFILLHLFFFSQRLTQIIKIVSLKLFFLLS